MLKREKIEKEDISESVLKDSLPKIETTRISDKTTIQKINGKEYELNYDGDTIIIIDKQTQTPYIINMDQLIERNVIDSDLPEETQKRLLEIEEQERAKVKSLIKELPASVLIDLSIEAKTIILDYDSSDEKKNESARFDQKTQCIIINTYNLDNLTSNTIAHEIGHALSQTKYKNFKANHSSIEHDSKFNAIFMEEYKALENVNDWEIQYASKNYEEMFAECYALLNTGSCDSNHMIAKYFPKSFEYVKNKIEQIRKLPENKRFFAANEYIQPKYTL